VEEFLTRHPGVTFHFTPTYPSWLNQIELWFSKLERDVIARGIFKSRLDLKRKIMRCLRHYNKAARPFKWIYRNPSHRIRQVPV
jgi:transposase